VLCKGVPDHFLTLYIMIAMGCNRCVIEVSVVSFFARGPYTLIYRHNMLHENSCS